MIAGWACRRHPPTPSNPSPPPPPSLAPLQPAVDGRVEEDVASRALYAAAVQLVHLVVVELVPAARVGAATEGRVVAALHRAEVVHHSVQVVLVVTVSCLGGGGGGRYVHWSVGRDVGGEGHKQNGECLVIRQYAVQSLCCAVGVPS